MSGSMVTKMAFVLTTLAMAQRTQRSATTKDPQGTHRAPAQRSA